MKFQSPLVGTGIYTVPEAARLTRVSRDRIRRWVTGYSYRRDDRMRRSPPVWTSSLGELRGTLALGFLDLLEVRPVNGLLERGVGWRTIRKAHRLAADKLGSTHPFCTHRFRTDGRELFLDLADGGGEPVLIEISKSQQVFRKFLEPYLSDVDFAGDVPRRWWPLAGSRSVVIDPERNFGKPTVDRAGIPTRALADAVRVENSMRAVAIWFEIDEESVMAAVRFEKELAA